MPTATSLPKCQYPLFNPMCHNLAHLRRIFAAENKQ